MFFNHLSSRNDPLHQAISKKKITPGRLSAPDAIAKALQHAAPGTPEKEKSAHTQGVI